MISTALEAFTAFSVTNIDDIVILVLLFSRLDKRFRGIHVVTGQFLGIAALVGASLIGFAGRAIFPEAWIGLLGLVPISLGLSNLVDYLNSSGRKSQDMTGETTLGLVSMSGIGWAGMLGVASLTIANGSDNIGVYMPLFAHQDSSQLIVTLCVFAMMTLCWCFVAWRLTKEPLIALMLHRYGSALVPVVLIAIGSLILVDSHALQHPPQLVITLTCLIVMVCSLLRQLQDLLTSRSFAGVQ